VYLPQQQWLEGFLVPESKEQTPNVSNTLYELSVRWFTMSVTKC